MSPPEQPSATAGQDAAPARGTRARRPVVLFLITFAIVGGAFLATGSLAFLTTVENQLVDLRIAYFTPSEAESRDVAVVTIDEVTVADPALVCRQPLDREYLARVVEALGSLQARAIGLDYLFDRPTDPAKDGRLKRAIAAAKVPVAIAWADETSLTPWQRRELESFTSESGAIPGNVHLGTQAGVARRLDIRPSGPDAPATFSVAIAEALGQPVPETDLERVFRGRPPDDSSAFAMVPAHVLLKNIEARPEFLRSLLGGKIVLVGADLPEDRHTTPVGENVPGVVIHAHAMAQVLEGRRLPRSGLVLDTLLALLVAAVATGLVILDRPQLVKLALAAVGTAALWAGGFLLYFVGGPLIPLVAPALGLGTGYGVGSAFIGGHERRLKEEIRKAFRQFLAPELVEELAAHPERLKLGGETRDMTIMFMDIRGFTTLSELLTPEKLTSFINGFLTPMTEIILDCRGTIDKYIGDCIMAFWNAPLDDPKSAANACRTALRMTEELDRINQSDLVRSLPHPAGTGPRRIAIGIGLNSGKCNVGNMGSKQRFAYSAMGDAVNLAARLEGQSKTYRVNIVIGEQTADEAGEFATLELDLIRVKGKTKPVRIHALLGDERIRTGAAFGALLAEQQAMLAAYRKMDWDAVDRAIARCRGRAEAAGLELGGFYDLYSGRVAAYRTAPPPPDWDGVYIAASK